MKKRRGAGHETGSAQSSRSRKIGRTGSLASVGALLLTAAVRDLRKPDSLIRSLLGAAKQRFLTAKTTSKDAIDITDKVEVMDIDK